MITKTLKEFASPIISKALATGARSSTTEVTNYGGIGDAMFKKAQLDMNMAQLTNEAAQTMYARNSANIDLKARNSLQIVDIERVRQAKHEALVDESKDMGDMEKAMGTLQGIATGATAGFAAGNVPGAVIGGVAGGAMAAQNYYGESVGHEKKRETGMRNQQMMGTVATLATSLRTMHDKYQGQKVSKSVVKDLADSASTIAKMGPGVARDNKVAEFNAKAGAAKATLIGVGANPEVVDGIMKYAPGITSIDPDTRAKATLAQNKLAAAADANFNAQTPEGKLLRNAASGSDQAAMQLIDRDPTHQLKADTFYSTYGLSPEVRAYDEGVANPNSVSARGIGSMPSQAQAQAPAGAGSMASNYTSGGGAAPQKRVAVTPREVAPIQEEVAPRNTGDTPAYMLNNPGVGGGVTMDDRQNFLKDPMDSINRMNSMGAQSAEMLQRNFTNNRAAKEDFIRTKIESEVRNEYGTRASEGQIREAVDRRMNNADVMNELGNPDQHFGDSKESAKVREAGFPKAADNRNAREKLERSATINQAGKEASYDDPVEYQKHVEARSAKLLKASSLLDNKIESDLSQWKMNDTQTATKAGNVGLALDKLNDMQALVDEPLEGISDSPVRRQALKLFIGEMRDKKSDKTSVLGSSFIMSGSVGSMVGAGVINKGIDMVAGSFNKNRYVISSVLTPADIEWGMKYHRLEEMAITAQVKVTDNTAITNTDYEKMAGMFFDGAMTRDEQIQAIYDNKKNLADVADRFRRPTQQQFETKVESVNQQGDHRTANLINAAGPMQEAREREKEKALVKKNKPWVFGQPPGYVDFSK